MKKIWMLVRKFVKEEEGTETVEWAIVAALVIAAAATVWATVGTNVATQIGVLATMTT